MRRVTHIPTWGVWDRHAEKWLARGLAYEVDAANAKIDLVPVSRWPWELEVIQEDRQTGRPIEPTQECPECRGDGVCGGCGRDCLECDGEGVVEVA